MTDKYPHHAGVLDAQDETGKATDLHQQECLEIIAEVRRLAKGLGAREAQICFEAGLCHGPPMERTTDLAAYGLSELLEMVCMRPVAPGGTQERLTVCGSEYLCFALDLTGEEDRSKNHLAVAFASDHWNPPEAFEQIASYAKLLVRLWLEKLDLELQIRAENRRGDRLQRIGEQDRLTGLVNAATFRLRAEDLLGSAGTGFGLMLVDVNKFKTVNDVFGHNFGDRYLQKVACALINGLPQGSLIGRMGGDEFAALVKLPPVLGYGKSDEDGDTLDWIERFCNDMMRRCSLQVQRFVARLGKPDLGGVSIGTALFPVHSRELETLFELADAAMYSGKTGTGRSHCAMFRPDRHDAFSNRLLTRRFDGAIADNQIQAYFQPIISLDSDRIVGFEALARWKDPTRGLLLPKEFQKVFKDPSMSRALNHAVFQSAFVHHTEFLKAYPNDPLRISVNVTNFELMDAEFVLDLHAQLLACGVPWNAVTIEVTEEVMLGSVGGIVFRNLREMRERGARIALDDFGTGYGGLQHLKDWPIDILKIDKSFLLGSQLCAADRTVITAIAGIASDMGMQIVVEGVETDIADVFLRDLGCDFAQGYYYVRPSPPDELLAAMDGNLSWQALRQVLSPKGPGSWARELTKPSLSTRRSPVMMLSTSKGS